MSGLAAPTEGRYVCDPVPHVQTREIRRAVNVESGH